MMEWKHSNFVAESVEIIFSSNFHVDTVLIFHLSSLACRNIKNVKCQRIRTKTMIWMISTQIAMSVKMKQRQRSHQSSSAILGARKYFLRSFSKSCKKRVMASLLGNVWTARERIPLQKKLRATWQDTGKLQYVHVHQGQPSLRQCQRQCFP